MKLRRSVVIAVGCFLAWGAIAGSAFAADPTNLPIVGGTLSITADPTAPDFASVTLDGTAKTASVSLSTFEVNDARGTGDGWKVTSQATQFKEWDTTLNIYTVGGKTLATSSLSQAQPTVAQDGTTSASPSITAGPYTIDSGSAVQIASAALNTGMGKYDFSATSLTVSIPASTYARTYRSELTVTVASGP